MRTSLEIDDDVIAAAKHVARLKEQGIGKTISELARRGLIADSSPTVAIEAGVPFWIHKPAAIPVTNELVRSLADEE
jgi:hypothetical protein